MRIITYMTLFAILVLSCTNMDNSSLVGEWTGVDAPGNSVIMVFKENNDFDVIGNNGSMSDLNIKYEAAYDVTPHRLYLIYDDGGGKKVNKVPFGIFKFSNDELIIRVSTEQDNVPVGSYELPSDFDGPLIILKRK